MDDGNNGIIDAEGNKRKREADSIPEQQQQEGETSFATQNDGGDDASATSTEMRPAQLFESLMSSLPFAQEFMPLLRVQRAVPEKRRRLDTAVAGLEGVPT